MVLDKEQQKREIREAIEAGSLTLGHLERAMDELNSASGFGIADMLGFDLLGGVGKHMKMNKAQEQMRFAQQQVQRFRNELMDVQGILDFQIDLGTFLTFADFFLDGILADVFVQSRISDAKKQVNQGIMQVNQILNDLYRMERDL